MTDLCIHLCPFPCPQCHANRRWNEGATGRALTEEEFAAAYREPPRRKRATKAKALTCLRKYFTPEAIAAGLE